MADFRGRAADAEPAPAADDVEDEEEEYDEDEDEDEAAFKPQKRELSKGEMQTNIDGQLDAMKRERAIQAQKKLQVCHLACSFAPFYVGAGRFKLRGLRSAEISADRPA